MIAGTVAPWRGPGLGPVVRDALAPIAPAVGLLTQLGDTWFLLALALATYLFGPNFPRLGLDRRDGARLLAIALGAVAVTHTLKGLIGAPRPPAGPPPAPSYLPGILEGAYEWLVHASTGAFPSGHALGATAVWGGLAMLATLPDRGRRFALAGAVVLVVVASRLVLGLHVLGDVLAGMGIGLVVLGVLVRLPRAGHAVAAVLGAAVVGVALVPDGESAAILGAAVAVTVVWWGFGDALSTVEPGVGRVLAAAVPLGVGTIGSAFLVERGGPSPVVIAIATALAGLIVLTVPLLVDVRGRAVFFGR